MQTATWALFLEANRAAKEAEPRTIEISYNADANKTQKVPGQFIHEVVFEDSSEELSRPRLLVSLQSVLALKNLCEKELNRTARISEMLTNCRTAYFKELCWLREQLTMLTKPNAPAMVSAVQDYEVHWFDPPGYVDEEMRNFILNCIRETNKKLIEENFHLASKLHALTDGGEGNTEGDEMTDEVMLNTLIRKQGPSSLLTNVKAFVESHSANSEWKNDWKVSITEFAEGLGMMKASERRSSTTDKKILEDMRNYNKMAEARRKQFEEKADQAEKDLADVRAQVSHAEEKTREEAERADREAQRAQDNQDNFVAAQAESAELKSQLEDSEEAKERFLAAVNRIAQLALELAQEADPKFSGTVQDGEVDENVQLVEKVVSKVKNVLEVAHKDSGKLEVLKNAQLDRERLEEQLERERESAREEMLKVQKRLQEKEDKETASPRFRARQTMVGNALDQGKVESPKSAVDVPAPAALLVSTPKATVEEKEPVVKEKEKDKEKETNSKSDADRAHATAGGSSSLGVSKPEKERKPSKREKAASPSAETSSVKKAAATPAHSEPATVPQSHPKPEKHTVQKRPKPEASPPRINTTKAEDEDEHDEDQSHGRRLVVRNEEAEQVGAQVEELTGRLTRAHTQIRDLRDEIKRLKEKQGTPKSTNLEGPLLEYDSEGQEEGDSQFLLKYSKRIAGTTKPRWQLLSEDARCSKAKRDFIWAQVNNVVVNQEKAQEAMSFIRQPLSSVSQSSTGEMHKTSSLLIDEAISKHLELARQETQQFGQSRGSMPSTATVQSRTTTRDTQRDFSRSVSRERSMTSTWPLKESTQRSVSSVLLDGEDRFAATYPSISRNSSSFWPPKNAGFSPESPTMRGMRTRRRSNSRGMEIASSGPASPNEGARSTVAALEAFEAIRHAMLMLSGHVVNGRISMTDIANILRNSQHEAFLEWFMDGNHRYLYDKEKTGILDVREVQIAMNDFHMIGGSGMAIELLKKSALSGIQSPLARVNLARSTTSPAASPAQVSALSHFSSLAEGEASHSTLQHSKSLPSPTGEGLDATIRFAEQPNMGTAAASSLDRRSISVANLSMPSSWPQPTSAAPPMDPSVVPRAEGCQPASPGGAPKPRTPKRVVRGRSKEALSPEGMRLQGLATGGSSPGGTRTLASALGARQQAASADIPANDLAEALSQAASSVQPPIRVRAQGDPTHKGSLFDVLSSGTTKADSKQEGSVTAEWSSLEEWRAERSERSTEAVLPPNSMQEKREDEALKAALEATAAATVAPVGPILSTSPPPPGTLGSAADNRLQPSSALHLHPSKELSEDSSLVLGASSFSEVPEDFFSSSVGFVKKCSSTASTFAPESTMHSHSQHAAQIPPASAPSPKFVKPAGVRGRMKEEASHRGQAPSPPADPAMSATTPAGWRPKPERAHGAMQSSKTLAGSGAAQFSPPLGFGTCSAPSLRKLVSTDGKELERDNHKAHAESTEWQAASGGHNVRSPSKPRRAPVSKPGTIGLPLTNAKRGAVSPARTRQAAYSPQNSSIRLVEPAAASPSTSGHLPEVLPAVSPPLPAGRIRKGPNGTNPYGLVTV